MLRDTSNQIAGASDYLWSDQTLVNYINEGVYEIARRTNCLRDASTTAITQFTTVSGQEFYQLDERILSIMSIRMTGDYADLARAGHNDLDTYHQPDTYFFDPAQLENMPPGKPLAWSTDEGVYGSGDGTFSSIQLRLYPIPLTPYAGVIGNMRVSRLPLNPLLLSNKAMVPEIPRIYHMKSLDWAAYLALRGVDLDVAGGGALDRAKMFRGSFDNWIAELKNDMQKKVFKPAQFSFGRNGFSYERY
jgi:hypothetical protein